MVSPSNKKATSKKNMVSLEDRGILKRLMVQILRVSNFKVTLTALYILGDLIFHEGNKAISENTVKVLPLI